MMRALVLLLLAQQAASAGVCITKITHPGTAVHEDAKAADSNHTASVCDGNPGWTPTVKGSPVYSIGRCGDGDAGDETTCQSPRRQSEGDECKTCGPVHVLEFESGRMVLEYNEGEEPCSGGMFIPFFPGEMMWNKGPHIFIFFCAMVSAFLGVAIIADVFMAAIEVITSKEKKITKINADGSEGEVTFLVWNATVANLTLMALGSSAPEILLSVIETLPLLEKDAEPGGLGPGTIVGSAAFNLLVIIGICVMAIPPGEVRKIKQMGVFNCTAFFSVWAYVWLFICVNDDNVELWEAILTFIQFPVLVGLCYWLDKRGSAGAQKVVADDGDDSDEAKRVGSFFHNSDKSDTEALAKALCKTEAGKGLAGLLLEKKGGDSEKMKEDRALIARMAVQELQSAQQKSALQSKINARRAIAGRQRVTVQKQDDTILESLKQKETAKKEDDKAKKAAIEDDQAGMTFVEFSTPEYAVEENQGEAVLNVTRFGNTTTNIVVYFTTKDGTAQSGEDFVHTRGKLEFKPGISELEIKIPLIDDTEFEPDEDFFVQLKEPKSGNKGDTSDDFEFGRISVAKVTILNDDNPGTFSFGFAGGEESFKGMYTCAETDGVVPVTICRTDGSSGQVDVMLSTENGTAKAGDDFIPLENKVVTFSHQESQKTVEIKLVEDDAYEKSETFKVKLILDTSPEKGIKSGKFTEAMVTICGDEEMQKMAQEVAELMSQNFEKCDLSTETWAAQFLEAMNIQGEEGEEAGLADYVMHFLTFGWKVAFATCPPTSYYGGWLTFFVALGMIGLLTAFIADIAGIFGCLLGLEDGITAITFVALGTSLPDTFASMSAAVGDETADNSVGNVTGSNSVNVYLGLGLPWVIATLANTIGGFTPYGTCATADGGMDQPLRAMKALNASASCPHGEFIASGKKGNYPMAAGSLGFSVVIFCICAITCLGGLYLRRGLFGAELGGPMAKPFGFLFFSLWLCYVVVSSLETKGHIESFM